MVQLLSRYCCYRRPEFGSSCPCLKAAYNFSITEINSLDSVGTGTEEHIPTQRHAHIQIVIFRELSNDIRTWIKHWKITCFIYDFSLFIYWLY